MATFSNGLRPTVYVSGTVTRWFAGPVAVVALPLAVPDLAAPASLFAIVEPVLSFYSGNELLFLSGAPFAIARRPGED